MAMSESRLKAALDHALNDSALAETLTTRLLELESDDSGIDAIQTLLANLSQAEVDMLDGATVGTVVASKAVVASADKDVSAFRNVTLTNLDAGASGTAGTVDIFPATASKGKAAISCTDQDTDATVGLVVGAMAAARTITIADPGITASVLEPIIQTTVTLTSAQILALHTTPITVIASPGANKAVLIESVETRHAAGTAYANIAGGDDILLKYTDGSGAQCFTTIETTGYLDQATAQIRHYPNNTIGAHAPVAAAVVVASLAGQIDTGDYDVLLRIRYRIVATNFA